MFTEDEKWRAVELFIQYDKNCMAVINDLGTLAGRHCSTGSTTTPGLYLLG